MSADLGRLIAEAAKVLEEAEEITFACHVGPDGDALGSMMGLAIAAENAGKKVITSFGSPFIIPENLSFVPTVGLVPPDEFPENPGVMVVLDAGSADRLAELGHHAGNASTLIVIDHHVTNEGFGDIGIVDGEAAATAELVAELLQELRWPVTAEIATCLHTALVTDTGRFQYSATKPSTFQLAAGLVAAGANTDYIGQYVYERAPFGYLHAAGAALSRAQLDEDASVVSTVITADDLKKAGIDWGDIDNLINTIRLPVEADVSVLAKTHDDGRVKLSMRSRGGTDVGAIAAGLGGGGHRFAAGATVEMTADEAISAVIAAVKAAK
ncbi:MAG: bifunctional oligoribonuclease/PAP phosphatase NrnA [Actinobacteria bacterium]|nr:MAG: bifunctional oligoribonuclease/PAP phosphatase NrnA [Actinomycetota bacterium]